MMFDRHMYDLEAPASRHAAVRDEAWFRDNPKSTCRVRPLLEGESPIVDAMRRQRPAIRGYAILIHHERLGDKRRIAGVGIYPVVMFKPMEAGKAELEAEAKRFVRWFAKSAKTPPPSKGTAWVAA